MIGRIGIAAMAALSMTAGTGLAADPEKGESLFKRCRACHAITAEDGTVIQKGGKTGPNLYGVVGRLVGSVEDFSYGESLALARDAGLVWDEENLAEYIENPGEWLEGVLDDENAKSKMTFKLGKGAEDMAAYLASVVAEN